MQEVFQLIVSSFEGLDDNTSRSYSKRTSILETVAKVRSCVVMLDLECDALILEMFQHFLKAIRYRLTRPSSATVPLSLWMCCNNGSFLLELERCIYQYLYNLLSTCWHRMRFF